MFISLPNTIRHFHAKKAVYRDIEVARDRTAHWYIIVISLAGSTLKKGPDWTRGTTELWWLGGGVYGGS
jgi:hypothetical protein